MQIALIPVLPLTYDDGLNLQVSQLINRGYQPYTQIFTLASPLFVWFIGWLGKFGLSPTSFKLVFSLFGFLLLVNTAIITKILFGKTVALMTVFLLATATTFLAEAATTIVAVTPTISIATLSLVFTLHYFATNRLFWLPFGGMVWGVALFMSTSALSMGLITLFLIVAFEIDFVQTKKPTTINTNQNTTSNQQPTTKSVPQSSPALFYKYHIYKLMGLWLTGGLISLSVGLLLATPDIIFGHIFTNYAFIRENTPLAQIDNFRLFGQFVGFNIWLSLLAAYSLSRIYEKVNHPLWAIFIWGLVSFGWLMLQVNLRLVDMAILLPPLAIMAGWGLVDLGIRLMAWSQNWPGALSKQQLGQVGSSIIILIIYLWIIGLQINKFSLRDVDTNDDLIQLEQRPDIADFIQQHTHPQDCVIIDDAALAIVVNRLPAPQLVDLSRTQITNDFIDEETLETMIQEHACTAVVFSKRKYTQPLAKFKEWAKTYYPNEQKFARTTIYYQ